MNKENGSLKFLLNDDIVELELGLDHEYSPTTTVLEWLRSNYDYLGVKEGCAEGDCGACTVVIVEEVNEKLVYKAVTSCILFLPYLHGKQLLTVEHLSKTINGEYELHPVQEVLAKHNGSQCGYCTPGIVMSLFSFYKNKETEEDIQNSLSGNLCRCTGYESIKEAAIEINDLDLVDKFEQKEQQVIARLKELKKNLLAFHSTNYIQPLSLEEALSIKQEKPDLLLIGGASDIALLKTKKHQELPAILDLSNVKELKDIIRQETYWEIGASVTMEQLSQELKEQWPDIKRILDVFGSKQIRNVATIGGNVGSASPIGDLLPLLMAHQAEIIIQSKHETRPESLEEFILAYRKTSLMPDELISKIIIPIDKDWVFWSEKVSKRKQLDISTISAAFAVRLTKEKKIGAIILAYGGMAAMPVHASMAEEYLLGKEFEEVHFEKAAQLITEEFQPITDARASKEGRAILAANLMRKFYFALGF